jgi:hypothetical protein
MLTGRLTALNRFISRSAERGLPFFRTLRSSDHFEWGLEWQQALDDLKAYLTKLTTLSKPSPSATLLLYLAASPTTISTMLVEKKEHENKMKQFPVYFVSEALSGAKLNYFELGKIAYTVVMASRKLKHYFQAHRIKVLLAQPSEALFRNSEAIERIGKWATELNEFVVDFEHRSMIKSQVLVDFITYWTSVAYDTTAQFEEPVWIVHYNGAWGMNCAGIAAILTPPKGPRLHYAARLEFLTTNNIAEYEAVLLGLQNSERWASEDAQSNQTCRS